tara:strand:- start:489 stop:1439 length:951 start_codon:yes stop_codon:yes gene_type:complete
MTLDDRAKISISFLLAVIISISIFFLVMLNLPDNLFQAYEDFFSKDLGNEDKIFILGSSHVYAINPIIISEKLKQNDYKFEVYNLGSPGDDFEERERTVNMIIDKKPKSVVIGIEPRSFESAGRSITETPDSPIPSIPSINEIFEQIDLGDKKGILKNPKFALIRTIASPIQDDIEKHPYPNSPFLEFNLDATKLANPDELEKIKPEYVAKIHPIEKNSSLQSLNKIIDKLEKNDIKVIIFVTPHSKFYVDVYPENQKKVFLDIINSISEKNKVYSLYDKYADHNVWTDHTHLAVNEDSNFYSNDVADFIIRELKK